MRNVDVGGYELAQGPEAGKGWLCLHTEGMIIDIQEKVTNIMATTWSPAQIWIGTGNDTETHIRERDTLPRICLTRESLWRHR